MSHATAPIDARNRLTPRRWLRFSLRSAMLLVVVAAIGVSTWLTARERKRSRELERQNLELRNELGYLTIEPGQEDKLHAIGVTTVGSSTWKWRIYVPPGKSYTLHSLQGMIPKTGFTVGAGNSGSFQSGLSPGKQTLTVTLRRNFNKDYEWFIDAKGSSGSFGVSPSATYIKGNYSSTADGVLQNVVTLQPGKPLVMLRYRAFPKCKQITD